MSTGQEICRSFLVASRHVAKQHGDRTDLGCGVLDNGRHYYVVEDQNGKIVWEGDTHCRWCARVEAIAAMRTEEAA